MAPNFFFWWSKIGTVGAELVYGGPTGIFGSVQYNGEFGSGYSENELQLQIGYSF